MDELLNIQLFGQTYTFKADSPGAQAEAVALALRREVERIAGDVPGSEMNKLTIMILAALNFANENYELKNDRADADAQLTHRTRQLIQVLDQALSGLHRRGRFGPGQQSAEYAVS